MKSSYIKPEHDAILALIRVGVGQPVSKLTGKLDWKTIQAVSTKQGVSAIVLDGVDRLMREGMIPSDMGMDREFKKQWIRQSYKIEATKANQKKAAAKMAQLFHANAIRTYVLKGAVIEECYPNPEHRISVDMDCFLIPDKGNFDAWELGNELIRSKKYKVADGFYKNSTFFLPGLKVENHLFFTPFRGDKNLKAFENVLQTLLYEDKGENLFKGTWLYRPPVMVSALFLIQHAYSHFLHEGLTWRRVLDWVMFSEMHKAEIDWETFHAYLEEFGFKTFYDAFFRIGYYLKGELSEKDLSKKEKKMFADIWAPLDLHKTVQGVKGKLSLAGNTIKAWWKYHYFSEISMPHALWIQVKGFLFIKHPKLD